MNTRQRFFPIFILVMSLLVSGCAPLKNGTAPAATNQATATRAVTATSSVTPTATAGPSPIPYPTLLPTIEAGKIPGLVQSSLSIETLDPFNGHSLRRITGWSYGFNSGSWKNDNAGYQWLDASHLLLFPVVGETWYSVGKDIGSRPVVINLDTGKVWLPPLDPPEPVYEISPILLPRWSPDLGVLITSEYKGAGDAAQAGVTIFTPDGKPVARYSGKLVDVSPSGEKILNADNTWIDLRTEKMVHFTWGSGVYNERWIPIWSPDETHVYFCCYFYGDARTGESYTVSDRNTILDGHPDTNMHSLTHSHGLWLNDNYVLAQFDCCATYRDGFLPVFDIAARTFHNLGVMAALPDKFNDMPYTRPIISPSREYLELYTGDQSEKDPQVYMVNLKTFKSQLYHAYYIDWSANGKYAIVGSQVMTLSSKTLRPLPKRPLSENLFYGITGVWHPTAGAFLTISADKQNHQFLYLLDVESLTYRHLALPANFNETYRNSARIIWNPNGDRFVLAPADGSLWQLDYPKLEKLEQLTSPMANVKDIFWSPDGSHLSFVSGSDIYVVDTDTNP